jgi:Fic family protein
LSKGILSKPCFYISDYFESHRIEYYNALNRVRTNNDLIGWIKFFLQAVISTAQTAKDKFKKVTAYVHSLETTAMSLGGRPENTLKVIRAFYDNPILNSKQISRITGLSQATTDNILKRLCNDETHILYELTGYSRNRIFVLFDYLKIFA